MLVNLNKIKNKNINGGGTGGGDNFIFKNFGHKQNLIFFKIRVNCDIPVFGLLAINAYFNTKIIIFYTLYTPLPAGRVYAFLAVVFPRLNYKF